MARVKGSLNKATLLKMQESAANIPVGLDLPETDDEIKTRLSKTFKVLDKVNNGIVQRRIRSAIVVGAGGCGKTYAVDKALTDAAAAGIIKVHTLMGSTSAVGLYEMLYRASEPDCVLKIDDCDTIYGDMEAFNILKVGLDTNRDRTWISWNKDSKFLEKAGVPNQFKFEGSVIFISNKNLAAEVLAQTKMAPHYSALISRSVFLDLGIHTKREIYCRIEQVIEETDFLEENNIDPMEAIEVMQWIRNNLPRILTLSVRTVITVASLMRNDPDWRETAEVTLFKRS